jgi:all-trans-retinol dehydrogenase (NAD+)
VGKITVSLCQVQVNSIDLSDTGIHPASNIFRSLTLFSYDSFMAKYLSFYKDKTILITGAANGIGKRFAELISSYSGITLLLWDRNPEQLKRIKQDLDSNCSVFTCNIEISDTSLITLEADRLIKQNLLPDIIINCAGIIIGKHFHEHSPLEIDRTIQINTTGSMWVVQAFLKEMIKRGSGNIVNLGSASGYIGNPMMSVYAASKWAILGWSESLRIEMDQLKTGIRVTVVIPSYINTGMFDGVKPPLFTPILETDDIVNRMISGIAKGKNQIKAPFIVHFVPLLKAILPSFIFDWLAGNILGVYHSMRTFKGRSRD